MTTQALTIAQSTEIATPAAAARRVKRYLDARQAANTQTAYAWHWKHWVAFCEPRGYNPLPATPAAVADYLTDQAEATTPLATIRARLAAIGYRHAQAQADNPTKTVAVIETMKGIRRALGVAGRPKAPLMLNDLRRMVAGLPDDLRGIRARALLLIGWAGAFRRSELVALTRADVRMDDRGAVITIRHSKTDQESAGMVKVIPTLDADPDICPVRALRGWLDAAGITSGPLWRAIDRWGNTRADALTGHEVARIVKTAAALVGLDATTLAGHSLRAGFATEAAMHGADAWQIMEQTGHRSVESLNRYIRSAGKGARRATFAAFGMAAK